MENKYYWIIGLIAVIGIIFISGCIQQQKPQTQMVMLPHIEFEGTVVSLSFVGGVEEGGDITRPRDTGIVKIDKINSISSDFDWVSAGIEEGKEITIQFQYSARPAKIRQVFDSEAPTSPGNETPVSATLSFTKENDYFVYSTKSGTITKETETILPGLENGSKFKTRLWMTSEINVGKYQIIS